MKRFVMTAALFSIGWSTSYAQDASATWRNVLKRCAQSDVIGSQTLFFGVSNTIGPGSVWRFADDRSLRLIFELSDAFPTASDRARIIKENNTASCMGSSATKWNIKLGLPFSTGVTPISFDIAALLGGAHNVTVSVAGFAIDDLNEANWKRAFRGLPVTNEYVQELRLPNRVMAENVVKVTGLKAVFDFKRDFSADVQAKYSGKSFALGSPTTPASNKAGTSTQPTTNGAGSGKVPLKSSGSTVVSDPTTSPKAGAATGACGTAIGSPGSPVPVDSTNGQSPGTSTTSAATLHVDFSSQHQITICADGPFYIIAAYSRIQDSTPVGIAPSEAQSRLLITSVPVPGSTQVGVDRTGSKQ